MIGHDDLIAAGDLNTRLQLQKVSESVVSAGGGEPIPTWLNSGEVWANVASQGSREVFRASQVYPTVTHVVTIRWQDGITTKHRFRWVVGGTARILNITGIADPTNRRRKLLVYCTEAL